MASRPTVPKLSEGPVLIDKCLMVLRKGSEGRASGKVRGARTPHIRVQIPARPHRSETAKLAYEKAGVYRALVLISVIRTAQSGTLLTWTRPAEIHVNAGAPGFERF